MAYVSVQGGMWVPEPRFFSGIPALAGGATLDASADRLGYVFKATKTGTVKKLEIRFGTVTTLGGSSTLTIGIQAVDATTGDPDGTFVDSVTIPNGSIVSNTNVQGTLATGASVTAGTYYAVVVQYGTFTASDSLVVRQTISESSRDAGMLGGYVSNNLTGGFVKTASILMVSIEYDDGSYAFIPECYPVVVPSSSTYSNASTPDAIGLRWQLPFAHKIAGAWLNVDADGDFDLIHYDASTKTTLSSIDKDIRGSTLQNTTLIIFNDEHTCAANTTMVLAVEPSSATSIILPYFDVVAASRLDQFAGGQAFHYATAKNPATTADFTMTTTRRPVMGLLISAVDVGGASGRTHPGMGGGMLA